MLIGLGLIPLVFLVRLVFWVLMFHWPGTVARVLLSAVFLCLFGSLLWVVVITLIRTAIVALFFTRYSLAHLLGVVLFIGACGTGIVKLSGVWMLFPIAGLCALVVLVFCYISDQDPEGPAETPPFLRKALAQQRAARRQSTASPGSEGGIKNEE